MEPQQSSCCAFTFFQCWYYSYNKNKEQTSTTTKIIETFNSSSSSNRSCGNYMNTSNKNYNNQMSRYKNNNHGWTLNNVLVSYIRESIIFCNIFVVTIQQREDNNNNHILLHSHDSRNHHHNNNNNNTKMQFIIKTRSDTNGCSTPRRFIHTNNSLFHLFMIILVMIMIDMSYHCHHTTLFCCQGFNNNNNSNNNNKNNHLYHGVFLLPPKNIRTTLTTKHISTTDITNRVIQQQSDNKNRIHRTLQLYNTLDNNNDNINNNDSKRIMTKDGVDLFSVDNFSSESTTKSLLDDDGFTSEALTSKSTFGQSVSIRRPSSSLSSNDVNNKNVIAVQEQEQSLLTTVTETSNNSVSGSTSTTTSTTKNTAVSSSSSSSSSEKCLVTEEIQMAQTIRLRNIQVAILSFVWAIGSYLYQYLNPIQPIQLLVSMQNSPSIPISMIGYNNKPTVIDFWAPWCENCKLMAPTIQYIEQLYSDRINFILINGDDVASYPIIERFHVDAIPHIAFISADGYIQTALIGPVTKQMLQSNLDSLLLQTAARQVVIEQEETQVQQQQQQEVVVVVQEGQLSLSSRSTTEGEELNQAPLSATTTSTMEMKKKMNLPYEMLDVFVNKPYEERKVQFLN